MPSNKVIVAFILCFAVVISTWLLLGKTKDTIATKNKDVASVSSHDNTYNISDDTWKNILVETGGEGETVIDLTKNNPDPEETTLTAQMAKDFFSQYLLFKKGGKAITEQDIYYIVQGVLSVPNYTKVTGAVYTEANLHIHWNTNKDIVKKYMTNLNTVAGASGLNDNDDDPMEIVGQSLENDDDGNLTKLDPLIAGTKKLITDLLTIEVPSDAIKVHLDLLNSVSNMFSDLLAMRTTFADPIKSLSGTIQYKQHLIDFRTALQNTNNYFKQKLL